jgi:hypothetical protein
MQRLLRHVIFVPVRPGFRRQQKARLGSTGPGFPSRTTTSGRQALFQIDGFRLHRLADDAPYFIGCGAAMNESAGAEA